MANAKIHLDVQEDGMARLELNGTADELLSGVVHIVRELGEKMGRDPVMLMMGMTEKMIHHAVGSSTEEDPAISGDPMMDLFRMLLK